MQIQRATSVPVLNTVDKSWMREQDAYLRSLSTYDLLTLYGYTNHSQSWINAYLNDRFMSRNRLKSFTKSLSRLRYFPWYV